MRLFSKDDLVEVILQSKLFSRGNDLAEVVLQVKDLAEIMCYRFNDLAEITIHSKGTTKILLIQFQAK